MTDDIHRKTASELFDQPEDEVTPAQRRMAATANFAALYGADPKQLRQLAKRQSFDPMTLQSDAVRDNAALTKQGRLAVFEKEGETLRILSLGPNSGVSASGKDGYVKWVLEHRSYHRWVQDAYVLLPADGTIEDAKRRHGF